MPKPQICLPVESAWLSPISAVKNFTIKPVCNIADAKITVSFDGKELTPESNGEYSGTYGTYNVIAFAKGYRYYLSDFSIGDDAEGEQTFQINLTKANANTWDGSTMTEPKAEADVYQISTGDELAWFANHINTGNYSKNAVLVKDIDLGDYPWTPIGGTTAAKSFQGKFDGAGHSVSGIFINATTTHNGLFGYINNATISNLTVDGKISSTNNYVAGVAAFADGTTNITRCVNHVTLVLYFFASWIVYGSAATALLDVPGSIVQALGSAVIYILVGAALDAAGIKKRFKI